MEERMDEEGGRKQAQMSDRKKRKEKREGEKDS